MPAYAKSVNLPNLVKKPPKLPIPNTLGDLQISKNFEDYPSATITYEGIVEEDLDKFEAAYEGTKNSQYQRRITVDGIPFRVAPDGGYSYERSHYLHRGSRRIDTYKVTVQLESWWYQLCEKKVKIKNLVDSNGFLSLSKLAVKAGVTLSGPNCKMFLGTDVDSEEMMSVSDVIVECARAKGCYVQYGNVVRLKRFARGRTHQFSWGEQLQDGANTLGIPPYYNGERLEWEKLPEKAKEALEPKPKGDEPQEFEEDSPDIKTEYDGDEDHMSPPANTDKLVDLSNNFDESGPKKVKRTVVTVNGAPEREVVETWGFAYLMKDGKYDGKNETWVIKNPGKYWMMVEYRETRHIYSKVSQRLQFDLNLEGEEDRIVFDFKSTEEANTGFDSYSGSLRTKRVFPHPDYLKYIDADSSNVIVKGTNVEYLTEVVTQGWKLNRYIRDGGGEVDTFDLKEDYENLDDVDRKYYSAAQFKKHDYHEVTKYWLKPARKDYPVDTVPFSIEWSSWASLDPALKEKLSPGFDKKEVEKWGVADQLYIGLAVPDMDYVEPYLVWTESKASSSIGCVFHPEHDPPDDKRIPLTTGSESFYQSIWRKIDDDRAEEKTIEFSASGDQFSATAEKIYYRRIYGKPPDASHRKVNWKQQDEKQQSVTKSDEPAKDDENDGWIYRIYTHPLPDWVSESNSTVSNSYCYTRKDALDAAEVSLEIDRLQSSTKKSRQVSWYWPDIEPGDGCDFESDRFENVKVMVLSVSYTLTFDGSPNRVGEDVICLCDGTNLELGMYDKVNVRVEREKDESDSADTASPQGGDEENPSFKAEPDQTFRNLGGVLSNTIPSRRNVDPETLGYY